MVLYQASLHASFVRRLNRFTALCSLQGEELLCHVKNTGRLSELLLPGAQVVLSPAANPARKTAYDLVAVYNGGRLFNIDSQAPNAVFGRYLADGGFVPNPSLIRREQTMGDSRFDFYLASPSFTGYIEVKGVTLLQDGKALFPDAPTQRGIKHIHGLAALRANGQDAAIIFVLQFCGAGCLMPNDQTHKAFGDALRLARDAGVCINAYGCHVQPDGFSICGELPVLL